MPTIALRPSARALRRAIAATPPYRPRHVIFSARLDGDGYAIFYRPMAGDWAFSPSWCCLLVVPSDEEVE
jgi:hypothetical protein